MSFDESGTSASVSSDEESYSPGQWERRKENKKRDFITVDLPTDIYAGNASLIASTSDTTPLQLQRIVTSVLLSGNANVEQFNTSLTSAKRKMKESHKEMAQISVEEIKEKVKQSEFKCTIHFDGKLTKEILKDKCIKTERLAVLVGVEGESHLLGVPGLDHHLAKTNTQQ